MTGGSPARSGLSRALTSVRALLDRKDSEHEQIVIRLVFVTAFAAYAVWLDWRAILTPDQARLAYLITGLHGAGALLLLGHILVDRGIHPWRRYCGMALDLGCLTAVLLLPTRAFIPYIGLYLWVTLGMGFRYGERYMMVSMLASVAGLYVAFVLNPVLHEEFMAVIGFLLLMLMIPLYSVSLLRKLNDARARAEAGSRAKGRFLATMSHELRTPLNAILGMADLMRSSQLTSEQREMLHTISGAGQNLLKLIEDVLDFSKIEAGTVALDKVTFDLHASVAATKALIQHEALSRGLWCRLLIDARIPWQLVGPEQAFRQCLINLAANAMKFTETGGVTIRLSGQMIEPGRVGLRIEVCDTGIGVPLDAQQRIFDSFAQADETTGRRYGGTGLGLAISRELCTLGGGSLELQSQPGEGATFIVNWPFRVLEPAVKAAEEAGPHADRAGRLVVYARPDDATTARQVERADVAVVVCRRWDDVLAALRDQQPQALWLAAPMPEGARLPASQPGTALLRIATRDNFLSADLPMACRIVTVPARLDKEVLAMAVHALFAEAPGATSSPAAKVKPLRILLAEDNTINQRVISRQLRKAQHEVTIVANGDDALDQLSAGGFDIALVDINMPELDGIEALRLYAFATQPDLQVPWIALTADATQETRALCLETGFSDVLVKPITTDMLLESIQQVHETWRTAQATPARAPAQVTPIGGRPVARIDVERLQMLADLDDDAGFLRDLSEAFIEDSTVLLRQLDDAVRAGDVAAFRDAAHALRSSAAHLGVTGLFELCSSWRGVTHAFLSSDGPSQMAQAHAVHSESCKKLIDAVEKEERARRSRISAIG
ncbi:MAG: ATP-binding protein [Geminicoccaceae bacterium]